MSRYLLDTCAMGDLINRRKGVHERGRENGTSLISTVCTGK
ncbi:MAG: hypothetical protein ABSE84_12590 [Isosphaeraceae bacterium]